MTRILSGAAQGLLPFYVTAHMNRCQCTGAPQILKRSRDLKRMVRTGEAYWSLIQFFFGHVPGIISVSVVDIRDGAVMWRDGVQLLQEDASGQRCNAGVTHP